MATITTINAADKVGDSRATINTNFSNLNAGLAALETITFDTLSSSTGTCDLDISKEAGKLTLTENTSINVPTITGLATGEVRLYHLRVVGASTYTLAFNASFLAGDPTPDVTMTAGAPNDYILIMDKDADTVTVVSAQAGAA